jgi:UDP-glucuronate 4-epimerase
MKILVTGSAGFIGFHVCKKLIEKGNTVIGIDNLNKYYDQNLKKARLKILHNITKSKKKRFIFFKTDISNRHKIKKIFSKFKFDKVLHFAAQAGVRYSLKNPSEYIKSNQIGFFNIIDLSKIYKTKHFIYASSSSVYGDNSKLPFSENSNTDQPRQIYAATKKSNELMAYSYSSLYNLKTTGLRYFTVYGPWGRPDMALFKFTQNILKKKKITVYNRGNHERDFTYIDDVVKLTLLASNNFRKSKSKSPPYRILNVGSSSPIKLSKFINIIEKILNIKSKKRMLTLQPGDMIKTYSNSTKIFKLCKYTIKSNHYENVLKFINWFKQYYFKKI